MRKNMRKHNRYGLILIFLSTLLLHGCGEEQKIKEQLEKAEQHAQLSINRLRDALNDGHVTNASVLKSYSKNIASNYPEYKDLAIQLGLDAGTSGPLFSNLSRRLDDAIKYPDVFVTWQERYQELRSLSQASDISVFSDALSDPANVLSDMSEGRLPRVNAISRKAEQSQGASKQEVGQQLVGNPSYGNWRTHSSGRSFWEWYGMYSMFSNFYPSRYNYYDRWSSRRGYSYYNDVEQRRFATAGRAQKRIGFAIGPVVIQLFQRVVIFPDRVGQIRMCQVIKCDFSHVPAPMPRPHRTPVPRGCRPVQKDIRVPDPARPSDRRRVSGRAPHESDQPSARRDVPDAQRFPSR